jgi:outer membrane protein
MNIKKILIVVLFFFSLSFSLQAEVPHYLDFKLILNESDAGKKAQSFLKKKLESGIANIKKKEKSVQEDEKKIIQQKKIISAEEYKKKVSELRNKVSEIQKERGKLLENVSKQRTKARNEILKNLNPIVKNYMNEKKIRMVMDKKNILLADETLDITKDIMALLNKKLKSINLN